jgi:MFS family permease
MHSSVSAEERLSASVFPKGRLAVSLLFFANGFLVGSWAPKIPDFAGRLGLTESGLGLMILVFGLGSLVMMPLVGGLIARHGSSSLLKATAIGVVPTLLLLTLAPTIPVAVVTIFLLGGLIGAMDIAMNANAVIVERRMRRAIMSSCHGFWSLGGLVGAAIGGPLIAALGIFGHVIVVTLICAVIVAASLPMVERDAPAGTEKKEPIRLPRSPIPYLLGIMALFSMTPEGSVLDWGALYLRQELSATLAQSGFAFAAFSATMALMRFAGDPIRDRLGAVTTLRLCTLIALTGLVVAGQAPSAAVAILGFALAGIGISNMVPIAFSAAGNLPGLAPGIALSVVTFMGYSGILVAPSLIGFIAEYTSFSTVFSALPVLFVVVLLCSRLARHADMRTDH